MGGASCPDVGGDLPTGNVPHPRGIPHILVHERTHLRLWNKAIAPHSLLEIIGLNRCDYEEHKTQEFGALPRPRPHRDCGHRLSHADLLDCRYLPQGAGRHRDKGAQVSFSVNA